MKKEEWIKRYGEAAYEKKLQQTRDWKVEHREECNASHKKWREANPGKAKANDQEASRKGGKYYKKKLIDQRTGLRGERNKIRWKHARLYYTIKQATPNTVLHHEWIKGTSKYRGVALVDKEAHQRGIIKVIKILEGQITLFTEKELKGQEMWN